MTPEQEKAIALSRARARRSQAEPASIPVEPEAVSGDGFGTRAAGNLYKFAKGATLGLGDRLTAAVVSGVDDKINYSDALNEVRKLDKEHSENYPVSSTVSEIAGSIPTSIAATPVKLLQSASGLGRVGRAGLVGAGFGGVAGAASTEDFTDVGQTVSDTALGGVLGGVFGSGAQGIGEAAKKLPAVGRWIGDATGMTDAQKSARKAIVRALMEDKQTPEGIVSRLYGSKVPLSVSDVSGEGMAQLADAVTVQSGQGSVNARNMLEARRANRPDRVKDYLTDISPEDDAAKTIEDLIEERSKRARPMYAKALSETITEDNLTPELERLVKNPNVRKGVVHGASIQRNIADAENTPFRPSDYVIDRGRPVTEQDLAMFPQYADDIIGRGFVPDYEPAQSDELLAFAKKVNGDLSAEQRDAIKTMTGTEVLPDSPIPDAVPVVEKAIPNLRSLHSARIALDDRIEKARNRVTGKLEINNEIRSLLALRGALDDQLTQISPSIKEADQTFGGVTRLMDAVETGKDLMRGDIDYKSRAVNNMTGAEKAMMRIGAARDLRRTVENTRDNNDSVGKIAGSEGQRQRLRLLFDDEPTYENFIGKINDEETAKKFEDRILRRSQTTQLLSAVKDRLGEDYDVPLSKANLIGNVLQTVTAPLKNIGSAARSARAAEIQPIILNTDKKKVAESLLKLTPEALALVASQRRNSYAANIAKTLLTIEAGASVGGD